jgi:hypothetical protein
VSTLSHALSVASRSSLRLFLTVTAAASALACSQRTVTVLLHPLQASGAVSYVCRGLDGTGYPLSECNPGSVARGDRNLYGLLTQTETGEVAIVNVPLEPLAPQPDDGFVDVDPSVPGYGFLHIGARPVDIVSTPGGAATFVGVAEAGKPGIFALPTTCLSAPKKDETERDLTTWAACALPAAPGSMAIVVDPPAADGSIALSCDRSQGPEQAGASLGGAAGRECGADLTTEAGPHGRRKLLVALPDLGSIWVIDAQRLLDSPPGAFAACPKDAELPLKVEFPATPIAQVVPDDLKQCGPSGLPLPPSPATFKPTPAGFALADGALYVGDLTAPVVHAIDVNNPCALQEMPPLLPRSIDDPGRLVKTSEVAVSPLTPTGQRFVYAIDQYDRPTASVMAFDVSPNSTNPTPLVRPGSPYVPFEAPDRIQFAGSARDVTFVLRDRPQIDPSTGNVVVGAACDPDPRHSDSIGARYRPSIDLTVGARSAELRGLFANVLLTNGQLAIVDVEDFDAPCRRPSALNPSANEDYRGCVSDPAGAPNYIDPNTFVPTVTEEVSCRMVEPHRARATALGITSSTYGIHAPSLSGLPQLSVPSDASQSLFADRPKLLAVDFPAVEPGGSPTPAKVFVSTTPYENNLFAANRLELSPTRADRYSLVLPFNEPRAYPANASVQVTFEGRITGLEPGGLIDPAETGDTPRFSTGRLLLHDRTVGYCDNGVQDVELMSELGSTKFALAGAPLEAFALAHADYVVISGDFPVDTDSYWSQRWPDDSPFSGLTRTECATEFGAFNAKELSTNRFFTVLDAQQQVLLLAPRGLENDLEAAKARVIRASYCFPSGFEYFVRASKQWVLSSSATGIRHNIIPVREKDANGNDILNCRRDCNPRKRFFESRIFEINSSACTDSITDSDGTKVCYDACVLSDEDKRLDRGVRFDEDAARCIHSTPTERFALYRGTTASLRDMTFGWQTLGGFTPMRIDLAALTTSVSPQKLVPLPQFNWVSVLDAGTLGLAQISLDALGTLSPTSN